MRRQHAPRSFAKFEKRHGVHFGYGSGHQGLHQNDAGGMSEHNLRDRDVCERNNCEFLVERDNLQESLRHLTGVV